MTITPILKNEFQKSVGSPDLDVTTALDKLHEQNALLLGMGDGAELENTGLMARNNAPNKLAVDTDRKKRNKEAVDRAIELVSSKLNKIESEMIDLESKIADSREVIANNNTDIEFIRRLDTDKLYDADGKLDTEVVAFLKKHGYDDLDNKSADDIHHILTAIEVAAIEQNDTEETKIGGWLDRHEELRREAREAAKDNPSDEQRQRGEDIAIRDPEQLARQRMKAIAANNETLAQEAQLQVAESKFNAETSGFTM